MNQRKQMDYSLIVGGTELLARVEPLWFELREFHAQSWPLWAASLLTTSFAQRREKLLSNCERGLCVLLACIGNEDVAYCVCSIDSHGIGAVDSIYVRSAVRRKGIGHALMLRSIDWFAAHRIDAIAVDLMSGNDAAQHFYEGYGFRPRAIRLLRTNV
jgi:ribosomal protein S18 acetylase RimI-like enzyme